MPDSRDIAKQHISVDGINLIKRFEGFRQHSTETPDGRWVIGFGHTKLADSNKSIAPEDAEKLLRYYDLPVIENMLLDNVLTPLEQNEFDALVSFVFNIGLERFLNSSVLGYLNKGDKISACEAMGRWYMADIGGRNIRVDALVRRRAEERALFLRTSAHHAALAPSAVISPLEQPAGSLVALPDPDRPRVSELFGNDAPPSLTLNGDDSDPTEITTLEEAPVEDAPDADVAPVIITDDEGNNDAVHDTAQEQEEAPVEDAPDPDVAPVIITDDEGNDDAVHDTAQEEAPDLRTEHEKIAAALESDDAIDHALTDSTLSEPRNASSSTSTEDANETFEDAFSAETLTNTTADIYENPFDKIDKNATLGDALNGKKIIIDPGVENEPIIETSTFETKIKGDIWPEETKDISDDLFDNEDLFDNDAIEPKVTLKKPTRRRSGFTSYLVGAFYAVAGLIVAAISAGQGFLSDNKTYEFDVLGVVIRSEYIFAFGCLVFLIGLFVLWKRFFSKV